MSETYKTKDKSQVTAIDIFIILLIALVALPILPFDIAYMFFMLKTNGKEKYFAYSSIAIIAILFSRIELFFKDIANVTAILIKGILKGKFIISAYSYYSFTSWILLVAVSILVATYAIKKIRYNHKLERAGVTSLERQYTKNGGKQYEYSY